MLCNSILSITSICGRTPTSKLHGASIHNLWKAFYTNNSIFWLFLIKAGKLYSGKVINFLIFMLCCVSFGLVGLIQVSPVSKIQVIFYSTAPIEFWLIYNGPHWDNQNCYVYKYLAVNKNKNIFEIKMKNPDSGPIRESLGAFLILAVGLLNFRTGNEACNINYIQLNKRYNFICCFSVCVYS